MKLEVVKAQRDHRFSLSLYLCEEDFRGLCRQSTEMPLGHFYVETSRSDNVYRIEQDDRVASGTVAMTEKHRMELSLALHDVVDIQAFLPQRDQNLIGVELNVRPRSSSKQIVCTKEELVLAFQKAAEGHMLNHTQKCVLSFQGKFVYVTVFHMQEGPGFITEETQINVRPAEGRYFDPFIREDLSNQTDKTDHGNHRPYDQHHGFGSPVVRPDWRFDQMGIGGLNEEFSDIFRRAFASRVFPPEVVKRLGIKHVRGILLYGPPGTGKTLLARQIGKMLNGREPKVVNGPEILNKFVGQSEENIRSLFEEAEAEAIARGDRSSLHIIIFDEIDAICPPRGTRGGTGVADTVVNQLLSKIDGVQGLNNILVIGMTNRKDMIDEALLRSGRLEVHMEIGLPDEAGRAQILAIHTEQMRKSEALENVDLDEIAALTKNFTGAELEGLIKSASSFALQRQIDPENPTKPLDPESIHVTREDFQNALSECKPALGVSDEDLKSCTPNGMISFHGFAEVEERGRKFIRQVERSSKTTGLSILLEGASGTGKTALAAKLALESGFPFIRLVRAEMFSGFTEMSKCQALRRIFEDAYKSPSSIIILDEIERILDYVAIGPRFSNHVLQTILVYCKRPPPPGHRLMILTTTSQVEVLDQMGALPVFNTILKAPFVRPEDIPQILDVWDYGQEEDHQRIKRKMGVVIPIKNLLMTVELARQLEGSPSEAFFQALEMEAGGSMEDVNDLFE